VAIPFAIEEKRHSSARNNSCAIPDEGLDTKEVVFCFGTRTVSTCGKIPVEKTVEIFLEQ
jgi:hypothetical protein